MHRVQTLPGVDAINRNALTDSRGRSFKDLKRSLVPRWGRVWTEIACGYLAFAGIAAGLVWLDNHYPRLWVLWIVAGACAFGYVIAYVQLFFHEAAHFNIAPGRKLNDLLADIFLGLMIGQTIQAYRTVHLDHHRFLGTPQDTEPSYFDALNVRFILRALCGVRLLAVITLRSERVERADAEAETPSGGRRRRLLLLVAGLGLNLGIMITATLLGHWPIAIAWAVGMAGTHPLINAVRQLLEHRDFHARAEISYRTAPHGPVTRMFGNGLVASTLGGAGFNRHLLHHWEPQISYTRLAELESFMLDTPHGALFRAVTTTYGRAFARLWRAV
jgi:fatty acid desaturase